MYFNEFVSTVTNKYVIGRTKRYVSGVRDFQPFNESRVMYFLYLNNDEDAIDAIDSSNKEYIMDVESFCDTGLSDEYYAGDHLPEFNEDSMVLYYARQNFTSPFILLMEVFILGLMAFLLLFNTFWVTHSLRNYHIPVIVRNTTVSWWLQRMTVGNVIFFVTWLISGTLPYLSLVMIGSKCLSTTTSDVDLAWTDQMQYMLAVQLIVIVIPVSCMAYSFVTKDTMRLYCLPCVVANLIFGFIMLSCALYIVIFTMVSTDNLLMHYTHVANAGAIGLSLMCTGLYEHCMAADDVQTETNEEKKEIRI